MQPIISVIVPIYGIDKYLGICIESIINQTYENLEIILVDDGSPDRCPEICDLYARKDPRIKVIHKENGGLVSARKAGVQASTGEYIGYVDGDDWIGPGFYQSLYSSIAESHADVAIAGFSRDLFSKCQTMLNAVPSGIYEGETLKTVYGTMISDGPFYRHGITTYVWNKLFKRDRLLPRQLAVDERITIGEDAAVVYPLLLDCRRVCITDNCAYHYRQREDSMLKKSGDFHREAERLKVLYHFLYDAMGPHLTEYRLKEQIDDFITGTYIIRSGGAISFRHPELKTFPLSESIIGKRVLLYGAGTFGQQLMKRLQDKQICRIAGWVDDDYWEYRRCCMDVDPVKRAADQDYDYILIANLSCTYADSVKKELLDFGVSSSKILTLQTTKKSRDLALSEYLALCDGGLAYE